jgi:hypothetical protein
MHSLFLSRVLRRIFGPKREEMAGSWRKLHNENLRNFYALPNIIRVNKSRRMRSVGHVVRMGAVRNDYKMLVGKPEGKRPLVRPRRRWEGNISMGLREIGRKRFDWMHLAQNRDQ